MQSVAVLHAVCRRWRASLTLVDQVAAQVSVSYASQAFADESVVVPSSVVDCTSVGTTLCATNYGVRNEVTSSLLRTQWSNGEGKRQVLLQVLPISQRYIGIIGLMGTSPVAVLHFPPKGKGKYPCILA